MYVGIQPGGERKTTNAAWRSPVWGRRVTAWQEVLSRRAGEGSSIPDSASRPQARKLIAAAEGVWADADLRVKVTEPTPIEYSRMRHGETCSPNPASAGLAGMHEALLAAGTTSIGTRRLPDPRRRLPLLAR